MAPYSCHYCNLVLSNVANHKGPYMSHGRENRSASLGHEQLMPTKANKVSP